MNICKLLYEICGGSYCIGRAPGTCVFTGDKSIGLPFKEWVSGTFTDFSSLKPGDIVSNEAAQCFDERSETLMRKVGADKPQRFRNYSHFIDKDGNWHCFSKANKREMLAMMLSEQDMFACIAASGQKHILFKTKMGYWNFEGEQIVKDVDLLQNLNRLMLILLDLGASKSNILKGHYSIANMSKEDILSLREVEREMRLHRGTPIFSLCIFLTQNANN